jgi:hypothetical protein
VPIRGLVGDKPEVGNFTYQMDTTSNKACIVAERNKDKYQIYKNFDTQAQGCVGEGCGVLKGLVEAKGNSNEIGCSAVTAEWDNGNSGVDPCIANPQLCEGTTGTGLVCVPGKKRECGECMEETCNAQGSAWGNCVQKADCGGDPEDPPTPKTACTNCPNPNEKRTLFNFEEDGPCCEQMCPNIPKSTKDSCNSSGTRIWVDSECRCRCCTNGNIAYLDSTGLASCQTSGGSTAPDPYLCTTEGFQQCTENKPAGPCEDCGGLWECNNAGQWKCNCGTYYSPVTGEFIFCNYNSTYGCVCGDTYRACR